MLPRVSAQSADLVHQRGRDVGVLLVSRRHPRQPAQEERVVDEGLVRDGVEAGIPRVLDRRRESTRHAPHADRSAAGSWQTALSARSWLEVDNEQPKEFWLAIVLHKLHKESSEFWCRTRFEPFREPSAF